VMFTVKEKQVLHRAEMQPSCVVVHCVCVGVWPKSALSELLSSPPFCRTLCVCADLDAPARARQQQLKQPHPKCLESRIHIRKVGCVVHPVQVEHCCNCGQASTQSDEKQQHSEDNGGRCNDSVREPAGSGNQPALDDEAMSRDSHATLRTKSAIVACSRACS
jgi:hypothetical protein